MIWCWICHTGLLFPSNSSSRLRFFQTSLIESTSAAAVEIIAQKLFWIRAAILKQLISCKWPWPESDTHWHTFSTFSFQFRIKTKSYNLSKCSCYWKALGEAVGNLDLWPDHPLYCACCMSAMCFHVWLVEFSWSAAPADFWHTQTALIFIPNVSLLFKLLIECCNASICAHCQVCVCVLVPPVLPLCYE